MKRFIPVIALLFVVALTSAFTSAPAQATDENGKPLVTVYFKLSGSSWVTGSASDIGDCSGNQTACVIELVKGDATAAQTYANGLGSSAFTSGPATSNTFDPLIDDEFVRVYPKN